LELDSDPLASLDAGRVPAIVVRGALPPPQTRAIASRLAALGPRFDVRSAVYETLGVDLHPYLASARTRSSPSSYIRAVQRSRKEFAATGLLDPVHALHTTLARLHPRLPAQALDVAAFGLSTNLSVGIFRKQRPGNQFLPHADTLHGHTWQESRSVACKSRPPTLAVARGFGRKYAAFRFGSQFSALLMLRSPQPLSANGTNEEAAVSLSKGANDETAGRVSHAHAPAAPLLDAQVQLFDAHLDELVAKCELAADSKIVNIEFAKWRESAQASSVRAVNLSLGEGDFYVFNSKRLHEVMPIPQHSTGRLVLGAFVGYAPDDLAVWS